MKALMSVDVEDWFQTENFRERIPRTEWNGKDLRVRKNVELILNILEKNNAKPQIIQSFLKQSMSNSN